MGHLVPDWNMEDDSRSFHDLLATANPKKPMGRDNEIVELLWQNGHVVMHSPTQRTSPVIASEPRQAHRPEPPPKFWGAPEKPTSNPIHEDETASWIQYPLDDPLERELYSDFFYSVPDADVIRTDKPSKDVTMGERFVKLGASEESNVLLGSASKLSFQENTMPPSILPGPVEAVSKNNPCIQAAGAMPPSRPHVIGSDPGSTNGSVINFSHFSRPVKVDLGSSSGSFPENGSSMCGSNQVHNRAAEVSRTLSNDATGVLAKGIKDKEDAQLSRGRIRTETYEAPVTSSSGGSGSSFARTGQQSPNNQGHKRKGRDVEESDFLQSEDPGYDSVDANKTAQRSGSARRSRAAEIHNLSERRRRDRINEKMRALQELIPHCNKSDKASMLDEAIEYLKSLQLQVQIMWMGGGMAPMMFPGMQQYMSRMGMGMGMVHSAIPSIHGSVQLPRAPLVNQSMPTAFETSQTPFHPSPSLNLSNFPSQMQNVHLPAESYARYLGLLHMQQHSQGMNLYAYGPNMAQQNQSAAVASSSGLPTDAGVPSENIKGQSDDDDRRCCEPRRIEVNHGGTCKEARSVKRGAKVGFAGRTLRRSS